MRVATYAIATSSASVTPIIATCALHGWPLRIQNGIEITTEPENLPSQRVIEAVGGELHEKFIQPPQFGSKPGLRYRVALA